MKKIGIETTCKRMLADVYTPVGIYLRLRDKFRDTVLLESADNQAAENSYSYIGINAIGGIELVNDTCIELKYPLRKPESITLSPAENITEILWKYMQQYQVAGAPGKVADMAQGLFGYICYDAVHFFEKLRLKANGEKPEIPYMRYRFYQYVIAINHFRSEMFFCENKADGLESAATIIESLIRNKDVPQFPFNIKGSETVNMSSSDYIEMVNKGIKSCLRGDVFQIVLSRRFQQSFTGDEFNVYRTLRSINPSPYLFYFDYGDYRLFGSSPESQLIIKNQKAVVHPIAGTFKRTGDSEQDALLTEKLLKDAKENAEHTMLVDLARNDLSRTCTDVKVSYYRKVQYYSHVIHLVSEITGKVSAGANPFQLLATTFPQGTLSGAPKFKAMQLIDEYEPTRRSYYGGCIGFVGFNGSCNHAIMIRTFLSKSNTLYYQAGAGIVAASNPDNELQEVQNKLGALKHAITAASDIDTF